MRSAALLLSNLRSVGKHRPGRRVRLRRRNDAVRRSRRPAQCCAISAKPKRRLHRAAMPRTRPVVLVRQAGFAGMALH